MRSSHACPPGWLDTSLEIDPSDWTHAEVYDLVTSLVIPRPVAWVSTLSAEGYRNLAPHSYFNLVADDPPHIAFSSIGVKDTLRNIQDTGEFVVNFAGRELLPQLDATGASLLPEEDEFLFAGLTAAPSRKVRPPRVAEARAHMECVLVQVVPVGNGHLTIGRVVHVHVSPSIWKDGGVAPELLDPVVRLSRKYGMLAESFTPEEEPSLHVLK
jgi:flavin reductase (DIM6/NTAB) family NADH-FMN oxidoreductase RutF